MRPTSGEDNDRYWDVAEAESALTMVLIDLRQKYNLTFGETVAILSSMLSTEAKYARRHTGRRKKP